MEEIKPTSKVRKFVDDRAPILDKIKKIIEHPNRRRKAIVCIMASSGIRAGVWDYLKWKHITSIKRNGAVIAAKIIVYAGEREEYYSFISPEAYHELEKWIEYRIHAGELINKESWIMRNIWLTNLDLVGNGIENIENNTRI